MVLFPLLKGKSTNRKTYQYGTFSLGKITILHFVLFLIGTFSHWYFSLYTNHLGYELVSFQVTEASLGRQAASPWPDKNLAMFRETCEKPRVA